MGATMNETKDVSQPALDAVCALRRGLHSYRISEADRAAITQIAMKAALHDPCRSRRELVDLVLKSLWTETAADGQPRLVPPDRRPSVHQLQWQLRKLSLSPRALLLQRRSRFVRPER
jgi:hypothetical protein